MKKINNNWLKVNSYDSYLHRKGVYSYSTTIVRLEGAEVTAKGLKELMMVRKRSENKEWKHEKLYSLFRFDDLWITAYGKLSESQGSTTPGIDNITIDGTTRKKLENLKNEVLTDKFQWTEVKRVYIPKSDGKERPLGIPSFKDRLVQEIVRMILNEIYEPSFVDQSMGFRPNRSQHTALREVRKTFKGCIWTIEGDISKFFDAVNHETLMLLLRKRIKDNRFLKLIEQGLKSKIILPDGLKVNSDLGTPQGGICSPILANIYLHELDLWIQKEKELFDKGLQRKHSKDYNRLQKRGLSASQIRNRGFRWADPQDCDFRRLEYIRYADDFLIGLIASKEEAIMFKEKLREFLQTELKLRLNEEKTFITHWEKEVPFLGYRLRWCYIQTRVRIHRKFVATERRILKIVCDRKKVVQRLAVAGFCTPSGKPTPNFRYLHQTQELSNRRIKALLDGLCSYYKLADDRQRAITYFGYILRMSLAKLYAAKFRLRTSKRVFRRAGKYLDKPCASKGYGAIDLKLLEWGNQSERRLTFDPIPYAFWKEVPKPDRRFKIAGMEKLLENPLKQAERFYDRGMSSLGMSCLICGSSENVEMHHVRGVKYHPKGGDPVSKAILSANRKVVPLCRKHHEEVHRRSERKK